MKYPVYKAIPDEITTISLVENPAMQLPMYCFEESKIKIRCSDLEHNIISCICRVDYPILRIVDDTPFYIVFDKEASKHLCRKLMTDGFQQCISVDHNGKLIEGIQLQEVFIKDVERGINPEGFEDAADGSLFGIYHIEDESLWDDCINGRFNGVSLESYVHITKMRKMTLKEKLQNLLLEEFNTLSTDKAELRWDEETELQVGYKVFVDSKVAADGEYVSDNNVIVVKDGIVTEIKEKAVAAEEEKPVVNEEKPEEQPVEPNPLEGRVAELESKIMDLENRIMDLENKIIEMIQKPVEKPVVEQEFEDVNPYAAMLKGIN